MFFKSTGKAGECPFLNPTPACGLVPGTCHTGNTTCAPDKKCCLDNDCHHKCTLPTVENGKNATIIIISWLIKQVTARNCHPAQSWAARMMAPLMSMKMKEKTSIL